ncbi:MAG: DUF2029 domain-containing protein [Planctomycetales bacterium]|nr:DUF2029 domain-containing protein [Planctomycetales bacterium]
MRSATVTCDQPTVTPALSMLGMAAAALVLVGVVRLADTVPGGWQRNDFAHYYLSARACLDHADPYTTSLAPYCRELGFEYDPRITAGTNPPPLMGLVSLVAWLPPSAAYAAWTVLQTACLIGLIVLLCRHTAQQGGAWNWLAVGVVLNSTAVWSHFHYSQVQLLVALLIAAAFFAKQEGKGPPAVALVALAAGLKLYPAALLPWFVMSGAGGWPAAARRCLTAGGVGALMLLAGGLDAWHSFATHALGTIGNSVSFSTSNYSLPSGSAMLAGAVYGRPLPAEVLANAVASGQLLGALLIAAAYGAIWALRLPDRRAIGLLTAAMILASPVCWSHYLVLMILPVWLAWHELSTRGLQGGDVALWLLAALCLYSELDAPVPQGEMGLFRTLLHLYPAAALLLFSAMQTRRQAAIGDTLASA